MLTGIDPVLTGALLHHLDEMGHSDAVVLADAHFPAAGLGAPSLDLPALAVTRVLRAVLSVLPLDDDPALDFMTSPHGGMPPVQTEMLDVARRSADRARFVGRQQFYDLAAQARLVVRTGETRIYGNILLRKGLAQWDETSE